MWLSEDELNLIVDIEQHEMITTRKKEVLSCSISVNDLVLRSIEYCTVD